MMTGGGIQNNHQHSWVHVTRGTGGSMEEGMQDDGDHERESSPCCESSLGIFDSLQQFLPMVQEEVASSAIKIELHSILNAFQHNPAYGVHVCESFRDPRKHSMDDYWDEVEFEAFSIHDLHRLVGGVQRQPAELSNEARAKLHQFSRVLHRLSKRIDRIVLAPQ